MTTEHTPESRLRVIAEQYLNDTEFLTHQREVTSRRRAVFPAIQQIIQRFGTQETDISAFRQQLDTPAANRKQICTICIYCLSPPPPRKNS
jgi:hypothetical protein